jgi:hypothetical protein
MRRLLMAGLLVFGTGHLAFGAVDWELEITDGTNSALINSAGTLVLTGADASGLMIVGTGASTGSYTFGGTVGNYTLNVTTGEGSPLLSPIGSLELNSANTTLGSASGALTIEWSENGISGTGNTFSMAFGGTLISGAGSNVSNTDYESNTNSFFAQTNTIGTIGPYSGSASPGTAFSGTASGTAPVSGTYSLTQVITLNGVGTTSLQSSATLDPTPEPISLVLLGTTLALAALFVRRRHVVSKAETKS